VEDVVDCTQLCGIVNSGGFRWGDSARRKKKKQRKKKRKKKKFPVDVRVGSCHPARPGDKCAECLVGIVAPSVASLPEVDGPMVGAGILTVAQPINFEPVSPTNVDALALLDSALAGGLLEQRSDFGQACALDLPFVNDTGQDDGTDLGAAEFVFAGGVHRAVPSYDMPDYGGGDVDEHLSEGSSVAELAVEQRLVSVLPPSLVLAQDMLSIRNINTKCLVRNPAKILALSNLIAQEGDPDLVALWEVGGIANVDDLNDAFSGTSILRRYSIVWSMRSTNWKDGRALTECHRRGRVGGGIALLVSRRLGVEISEIKPDKIPAHEHFKLNGHVRCYRLQTTDKGVATGGLRRTVVVSCAYIPPSDKKWGTVRDTCFAALDACGKLANELHKTQGVFPLHLSHCNVNTGATWVPVSLPSSYTDVKRIQERAEAVTRELNLCGQRATWLYRRDDDSDDEGAESLLFKPVWTREAGTATSDGKGLVKRAARLGMVQLAGLTAPAQPTSWQNRQLGKGADEYKIAAPDPSHMHGHHEQCFVPAELAVEFAVCPHGGRDVIRFDCARVMWHETVDHSILRAMVRVSPVLQPTARASGELDEAEKRMQPKLPKLPDGLLAKYKARREAAKQLDSLLADSIRPPDLDAKNARLNDAYTSVAARVFGEAVAEEKTEHAVHGDVSTREAGQKLARAWADLRKCSKARVVRALSAAESPARRLAISAAHRGVRKCERDLARAIRVAAARRLAEQMSRAPKASWKYMFEATKDKGAPKAPRSGLMDHLNKPDGTFWTRDRKESVDIIAEKRCVVNAIAGDLSDACVREMAEALEELHVFNAAVVTSATAPESAVQRGATDAMAPMTRMPLVFRERVAQVMFDRRSHCQYASQARESGDKIRMQFPDAVAALERDPDMAELEAVCALIKDVGASTDGAMPGMLKHVSSGRRVMRYVAEVSEHGSEFDATASVPLDPEGAKHIDSAASAEMLDLLVSAFRASHRPAAWAENRQLLLFKKGDAHDVDCYRGLGIGHLNLKLLSLIMTRRLEIFVTQTKAVSVLQGGFLPGRGCPEQIFTLKETVSAAINNVSHDTKPVHLAFLDIKRAYDSVLHPILWRRCMAKGIGGKFLAMLQAIYHEANAVLDIDGELLPVDIPILAGLMQGSPLSPLLFNLYIDPAVEVLLLDGNEGSVGVRDPVLLGPDVSQPPDPGGVADGVSRPFGLWCPRVVGHGHAYPSSVVCPNSRDQSDFLCALLFADDTVLLARDSATLQHMVNLFERALSGLGLSLNHSKTKHLIVPPACDDEAAYTVLKQEAVRNPIEVDGHAVEVVDKFLYLGMLVWWRWNWDKAWFEADKRARAQRQAAVEGAYQTMGSLHAQLLFARGTVLTHFDYVSAVAGAGGPRDHEAWRATYSARSNEVLRDITGRGFTNIEALRIESGTWPELDRINKLQWRRFCKMATEPSDSTHYRALALSIRSLTPEQCRSPSLFRSTETHRQPWAQSLLAATRRMQLPDVAVFRMRPTPFLLKLQLFEDGQWTTWSGLHPDAVVWSNPEHVRWAERRTDESYKLRFVLPRVVADAALALEGETVWTLPQGLTIRESFRYWTTPPGVSTPLRDATFAALQEKGNACRNCDVYAFLDKCRDGKAGFKSLRRYAAVAGLQFEKPYWHLPDARLARRILAVRLDEVRIEGTFRRRVWNETLVPSPNGRGAKQRRRLERLEECERACYLCGEINNGTRVFWPETLEHYLLKCPGLAGARDKFKRRIESLAQDHEVQTQCLAAGVNLAWPVSDATLFTLARVGTTRISRPVLQAVPLPVVLPTQAAAVIGGRVTRLSARTAALALRDEPYVLDTVEADAAVAWLKVLSEDWMGCARDPRRSSPLQSPGCRVTEAVGYFLQDLHLSRRAALRGSVEFENRARDAGYAGASR